MRALGKTALKHMKSKSCGILTLTLVINICEFDYPFARTEIDCVNLFFFTIHNSQLKNLDIFMGGCPFVVGFCNSEGSVSTKLHPSRLVYKVLFQQQIYFSLFKACNQQHTVQFLCQSNCMAWLANLLTLKNNISKLMFLRI